MEAYPVAGELVGRVLRVAMQCAVGGAAFLARYRPCGRRRIIRVPPQIQPLGA